MAIVCMTGQEKTNQTNTTSVVEPEFQWDKTVQGYMLSAFFYGYLCTQIIGGGHPHITSSHLLGFIKAIIFYKSHFWKPT